ncbi:hypothetical protein VTK56DRAFT_2949 [Thermocarpiscus australiensis]
MLGAPRETSFLTSIWRETRRLMIEATKEGIALKVRALHLQLPELLVLELQRMNYSRFAPEPMFRDLRFSTARTQALQ